MPLRPRKVLRFTGEIFPDALELVARSIAAILGFLTLFMGWLTLPLAFREEAPESPTLAAMVLGPAGPLTPAGLTPAEKLMLGAGAVVLLAGYSFTTIFVWSAYRCFRMGLVRGRVGEDAMYLIARTRGSGTLMQDPLVSDLSYKISPKLLRGSPLL